MTSELEPVWMAVNAWPRAHLLTPVEGGWATACSRFIKTTGNRVVPEPDGMDRCGQCAVRAGVS